MTKGCLKSLLSVVLLSAFPSVMWGGSPIKWLGKVGDYLDSAVVKGLDRRYVDAPERPWQVVFKGNVNQSTMKIKTSGEFMDAPYTVVPKITTDPSQQVGLWAGYRGYGIGYTFNVAGDKGGYFTLGALGSQYVFNLRIHDYESDIPHFDFTIDVPGYDFVDDVELEDPVKVHTLAADAYYIFNSKHFSYAAAYDQSLIQKRSAGSFLVGGMYFYGDIDYATDRNADLVFTMNHIGRMKFWQGSVGAGYAYNWVPARGLLVSGMAMPILAFVNKIKTYNYDTNVLELSDSDENTEEDDEEWEEWWDANIRLGDCTVRRSNSHMQFNVDARLSVTYNFGNCFVNAYGQFTNFKFHFDSSHGNLSDWYVNTSFGIRL